MNLIVPRPARGRTPARVLLPHEHGAYGQIFFPIATALALGDRSTPAFALALACAAGFAAHEALLVLLGQRGPRAARELGRTAAGWLIGCALVACAAGAYALAWMSAAALASLLLPVVLLLVLLWFIVRAREHSLAGETVAAAALSACSVPVALAGGVSAQRAATCWLVFVLAFVVATVAVHSVIVRVRQARVARRRAATGRAAASLSASAVGLSVVAALRGWLPRAAPLALCPVCALAFALSLFPPHPRHLRSVGWTLVTATAATAIVLTIAFR